MSEENTSNPIDGSGYLNLFVSAIEKSESKKHNAEFNQDDKVDNKRLKTEIINIETGNIYKGEHINYIPNGSGELTNKNGMKTIGEFKDGKSNGFAKKYYPNGSLLYKGKWKDGRPNGFGKTYRQNGSLLYEGYFKDAKPDGLGKEYQKNGKIRYEGYFKDGKSNGRGKIYHQNGTLWYEGYFKDGHPSNETE